MELRYVLSVWCLLSYSPLSYAQSSCETDYIVSCISTAVVSACGTLTPMQCICGAHGQTAIGNAAAPCLLSSCPPDQILSIGSLAYSVCDQWSSTYPFTTTAAGASNGNATGSSLLPSLTSTIPIATTGSLSMSLTAPASIPTAQPASTSTSTAVSSSSLPVGAEVGIGVGASALVCSIILFSVLLRRYRRQKNTVAPGTHEMQTDANIHELSNESDDFTQMEAVEIPRHELDGFKFPFQTQAAPPVEADSRSLRAGHPRGRMAGTEATIFDFESQKVLWTPDLRGSSRASDSPSGSVRRNRPDT